MCYKSGESYPRSLQSYDELMATATATATAPSPLLPVRAALAGRRQDGRHAQKSAAQASERDEREQPSERERAMLAAVECRRRSCNCNRCCSDGGGDGGGSCRLPASLRSAVLQPEAAAAAAAAAAQRRARNLEGCRRELPLFSLGSGSGGGAAARRELSLCRWSSVCAARWLAGRPAGQQAGWQAGRARSPSYCAPASAGFSLGPYLVPTVCVCARWRRRRQLWRRRADQAKRQYKMADQTADIRLQRTAARIPRRPPEFAASSSPLLVRALCRTAAPLSAEPSLEFAKRTRGGAATGARKLASSFEKDSSSSGGDDDSGKVETGVVFVVVMLLLAGLTFWHV